MTDVTTKTESTTTEIATVDQVLSLTGRKSRDFFKDGENIKAIVEMVSKEALSIVPNVETKKGRDEIGSLALKVSKSRTALEDTIDRSVESLQNELDSVKQGKKLITSELKQIREQVLAPRKAWQEEQDRIEQVRIDGIEKEIARIKSMGEIIDGESKEELSIRIDMLESIDASEFFEEFTQAAMKAISNSVSSLQSGVMAIVQEEKAKAQREALEAEKKKSTIQARLSNLAQIPLSLMGKKSDEIDRKIKSLENFEINELEFDEFLSQAEASKANVISQLSMMRDQAAMIEDMQAKQAQADAEAQAEAEAEAQAEAQAEAEIQPEPEKEVAPEPQPEHEEPVIEKVEVMAPSKPESQLERSNNAFSAQSSHNELHSDFTLWFRAHKISAVAFMELEILIKKHY